MSLDNRNKEIIQSLKAGSNPFKKKRGRPAKSKPNQENKIAKKQDHTRLPQEKPSKEFLTKQRGRPTIYEPWMCEKIIEIASQGGSRSKMIVALGIRREATLNEWCEQHPEFKEAYEICKHYHLSYYEDINLENAKGEIRGNATSLALTMNNYHSDIYKRNPDSGGGGNHTEININTINLSSDQMDLAIKQKMESLKAFGIDFSSNKQLTESKLIEGEIIENDK